MLFTDKASSGPTRGGRLRRLGLMGLLSLALLAWVSHPAWAEGEGTQPAGSNRLLMESRLLQQIQQAVAKSQTATAGRREQLLLKLREVDLAAVLKPENMLAKTAPADCRRRMQQAGDLAQSDVDAVAESRRLLRAEIMRILGNYPSAGRFWQIYDATEKSDQEFEKRSFANHKAQLAQIEKICTFMAARKAQVGLQNKMLTFQKQADYDQYQAMQSNLKELMQQSGQIADEAEARRAKRGNELNATIQKP
ncbi:hypothetical protein [Parachitinimonas caeni]|uniref:Uncharacterized protein n=1 Tax=Parachitinimonas caeni TaxID=3031301 RepID=A0ABT7DZ40_9NEIS|nr:hypothetical protein [Parachitinimonas caeni]MDK2125328.1 hypothetical protein [Parachitinimonas caeni]